MKLYTYFRSSASYRARIALNLKNVPFETVPKHLLREGGEHRQESYQAINPQGFVPALEHEGRVFGQSLAIIEYLDELYPEPPLLPASPADRSTVRSMSLLIACDIHPLNNLRVLEHLRSTLGFDSEAVNRWYRHWVEEGLEKLEMQAASVSSGSGFLFGDGPTMADICLVPQMYNARRFACDLSRFSLLNAVTDHLESLDPFERAAPKRQPDALA